MIRNLILMSLLVLGTCALALEQRAPQVQPDEDTLMCEVVELVEPSEYGYFVDPAKARPAKAAPVRAAEDIQDEDEKAASVKVSFEPPPVAVPEVPTQPVEEAVSAKRDAFVPSAYIPAPRGKAYETREPLFFLSNPNSPPSKVSENLEPARR
jgi:hypothetical protein